MSTVNASATNDTYTTKSKQGPNKELRMPSSQIRASNSELSVHSLLDTTLNSLSSLSLSSSSRTGSRCSDARTDHLSLEQQPADAVLSYDASAVRIAPTISPDSITPFNYQSMLRNRVRNDKLGPDQKYDMHMFTPTFVHDCLMLPGSLANILGKRSPHDIMHRMTPAVLPQCRAYVHAQTGLPCLVRSADCADYVRGIVIFGQGRTARRRIHAHYRLHARRTKLQVEIDVASDPPTASSTASDAMPSLQRRTIWAHAWLWNDRHQELLDMSTNRRSWSLENYLSGAIEYLPHPTTFGPEEDFFED